jgi:hypothetical protein
MAVLLDLAGVCTGLQVTPGMPVDKSAHDAAVDSVLDAKLKLSNSASRPTRSDCEHFVIGELGIAVGDPMRASASLYRR